MSAFYFFFSSRRRHTRLQGDWSSDVCSSDLLHYRSWFRRELAGYVKDVLTDTRTQQSPFWNPDFLKNMAKDHLRGRKNYVREINAVFTVEAIERLFFRDLQYEMSGPTNSWAKSLQEEPLLTR